MSNYPFLTAKERDNETGLGYFGARYYSSMQGRFVSADLPFNDQVEHDPQSWNLYGYVRNNPLRFIDPFGEARWEMGEDGKEHYVGDKIGEYDKELNATWDGTKWNFHDNNGLDNTVGRNNWASAVAVVVLRPSPPMIKLGEVAAVALFIWKEEVVDNGIPIIDPTQAYWAERFYVPPPDTLECFPGAKEVKSKSHRRRWADNDYIYEWDYQHGRIEKYNKRGKHLGEFDPVTCEQTKPAMPGRTIEP